MTAVNNVLKSQSRQERRPQFWQVLMRTCQIAAFVDITFFFMFHFLRSPILAWVNVFSVIMYCAAYFCLKQKKARYATALIWSEVLIHAALGIILIGWGSGFHYFLLIFIPAICLSSSYKTSLLLLVVLFLFYVGLYLFSWFIAPIQPINDIALKVVHVFNLSTVFVMLSYLSFFYLNTVRKAQKKLRVLAETDPLTALYNRRHMSYLGEKEMQRVNESNKLLCLMLIDVDHFKKINDKYGHKVGDDVLIQISQLMQEHVRSHDLVSRWGGEEFLIILPNTTTQDAILSAERIREAFVDHDWQSTLGINLNPTISVGVTDLRPSDAMSTAIARADRALYQCKSAGRNRVEYGLA